MSRADDEDSDEYGGSEFDEPQDMDAGAGSDASEDRETGSSDVSSDAGVLFSGDRGALAADTRRVFVQLLQGPFVDGKHQQRQWSVLLRDEAALRSRLHELYLDLVVAHDEKVAFVRQIAEEGLDAPILLRRQALTFIETALLLYLRQCLTQAQAQGERAVVSRQEMLEHLLIYERERNVDQAKHVRQMSSAIDKVKNLNLLRPLRTEDRFEVSPTLKLLFPVEQIIALLRVYRSLAAGGTTNDKAQAGSAAEENPGEGADVEATAQTRAGENVSQAGTAELANYDPEREILEGFPPVPADRYVGLEAVLVRELRLADELDKQAQAQAANPADEAHDAAQAHAKADSDSHALSEEDVQHRVTKNRAASGNNEEISQGRAPQ
jgi:hypothetical protein